MGQIKAHLLEELSPAPVYTTACGFSRSKRTRGHGVRAAADKRLRIFRFASVVRGKNDIVNYCRGREPGCECNTYEYIPNTEVQE